MALPVVAGASLEPSAAFLGTLAAWCVIGAVYGHPVRLAVLVGAAPYHGASVSGAGFKNHARCQT